MRLIFALLVLTLLAPAAFAEEAALHPQLQDFAPFLGKTYRGELGQPGAEKKSIDIQHWERILNGKGICVTHSINDGEYGGVTEVRSHGEFHADGRLTTTSEYMKDGEWVPGHSATYHEAPDAEVIFR